jgi:hypothetical protein
MVTRQRLLIRMAHLHQDTRRPAPVPGAVHINDFVGRGVHLSARGAADALTITSSPHASMKAIGRGVAVQLGTKGIAANHFAALAGGAASDTAYGAKTSEASSRWKMNR